MDVRLLGMLQDKVFAPSHWGWNPHWIAHAEHFFCSILLHQTNLSSTEGKKKKRKCVLVSNYITEFYVEDKSASYSIFRLQTYFFPVVWVLDHLGKCRYIRSAIIMGNDYPKTDILPGLQNLPMTIPCMMVKFTGLKPTWKYCGGGGGGP